MKVADMPPKSRSSTSKILHNSLWFGLETALEVIVFLASSIAVARYLGPYKLGYFSYINFFVSIINNTSGAGFSSATRKYMAEFLASEQPGLARAVYGFAYRYQLFGAITVVTVASSLVFWFGDPAFRWMSLILIFSIIPGIMSWIPAQANNAFEDVSKNTVSAFCYLVAYAIVITCTLVFRWDLIGVASAALVGRSVEAIMRTIPLHRRLRTMPWTELPSDIKARIRRFCLQSIGIQLITTIVWDRFEFLFLRAYSGLEQVAFYSVSFGFANNLLMLPRTFGGAVGITLMVESNRKEPLRIHEMTKAACRYLLFIVCPIHLGAMALAGEAVHVVYGASYAAAVPVLIVAAFLAIPRAFQEIADILVRAADRQKYLFAWLIGSGVLNLTLDALLIPRFGAIGAAWGNGLAQGLGVFGIWREAQRATGVSFPFRTAFRFLLPAGVMAISAAAIVRYIHGWAGLVIAIGAAVILYFSGLRSTRAIQQQDVERFKPLAKRLPRSLKGIWNWLVAFLVPANTFDAV